MTIVMSEPASITVHRNVTQRTLPHGTPPQLDCRTCVFCSERACACPDECDAGSRYAATVPLQLWRAA
jgi:hypothetical protein